MANEREGQQKYVRNEAHGIFCHAMGFWRSVHSFLGVPAVYRIFGQAVIGDGYRTYVSQYVRPEPGQRVLDIGCGPGDILEHLPAVHYTGFDINEQYIAAARKRFGHRGRFFTGDVASVTITEERGSFDLALATGVLHHLDDQRACSLLRLAHLALRPGGRLITYDGCFVKGQPRLARWVVSKDRGRYVRSPEKYLELVRPFFAQVTATVRHDLLRIPYTHLILACTK